MGNDANVSCFLNGSILLILRRSMYFPGRCDSQSSFDPAKLYGLWKLCLPGARQNRYDVHLPLGYEGESESQKQVLSTRFRKIEDLVSGVWTVE